MWEDFRQAGVGGSFQGRVGEAHVCGQWELNPVLLMWPAA